MGQCLPCLEDPAKDVVETPDPASSRGIKNVYSVEQKKKKQEEMEKRMAASRPGGEGGLRDPLLYVALSIHSRIKE
ncbi:small VCP interacting protein [Willisornis vidua]|uniref:Small VCP interacting protein n=1 Tax=Willisornis vidua TaxID=1566151 RepID=A0ABQ9D589_9PASS|nr:small VCP interacting protein [Willisornis vidua]